jgi:hypothetical protein
MVRRMIRAATALWPGCPLTEPGGTGRIVGKADDVR